MNRQSTRLIVFATIALLQTGGCHSESSRRGWVPDVEEAGAKEFSVTDGGVESCESQIRCSPDLHSVVEACTGKIIKECPSDMGCAKGTCVPACASAEANQGTNGCSFWTVPGPAILWAAPAGGCFASMIANTWNSPVDIQIEYEGEHADFADSVFVPRTSGEDVDYEPLRGPLPPGEVAVVFLSHDPNLVNGNTNHFVRCPRPPAVTSNPIPMATGKAFAFHLSTSRPVSAYSSTPYGGAKSYVASATVLLPTSTWGKNYFVIDPWQGYEWNVGSFSRSSLHIVAAADDTHVELGAEIELPADMKEGEAAPHRTSFTLSRGQVLQVLQQVELTGTPIQSDQPIAVFGGTECWEIPLGEEACDGAQQQIPPIHAWGSEYAAVRYRNRYELVYPGVSPARPESVPWRLVGAVDGTKLTYDPEPPPEAPAILSAGMTVTFWSPKPFVVKSQDLDHPFYMSAYMTGTRAVPESREMGNLGDPEFVNVIPTEQYLDSYVFFADMTYDYTTLVAVRRNDGNGFKDVELDCAGVITGWTPLDTAGHFEYAYVDLVRNKKAQVFAGGVCDNGRHEVRSGGPFTVTVWGMGGAMSYAYPVGAGLRPMTSVRVPVPVK